MCHPLGLDLVEIHFDARGRVRPAGRALRDELPGFLTGVEMESLLPGCDGWLP